MKNILGIYLLLSLNLTAVTVASPEPTFIIAMPVISDSPPYLWQDTDDKWRGSVIDVYQLMASKLGYQLSWRFYHPIHDADEVLEEYYRSEIDIFINRLPRALTGKGLMRITTPFHTVSINYVVRADSPLAQLQLEVLIDHRGIVAKTIAPMTKNLINTHFLISSIEGLPHAKDMRSAVFKILNNEADYTIGERYTLAINLHKWKVAHLLQIMQTPLGYMETSMWLHRDSPFNHYLVAHIKLGQVLHESGRFEHIKQRHLHSYIRELRPAEIEP